MRHVAILYPSQNVLTHKTAIKASVNRLQENHSSSVLENKSMSDSMPYFQPKDYVI